MWSDIAAKGILPPDMTTNWIEIAKAGGPYRALSGEEVSITPQDLDQAVASFDPTDRRVPLVFGHPKLDAPAFGWVEGLKRQGAVLLAQFKDVPDQVRQLVEQGFYRNVSAKFDRNWRLWHVGLLGAAQPAIPGLAEVKLGEGGEGIEIEFSREEPMNELEELKRELAKVKDALAKKEREFAALQSETANTAKVQELEAKIKSLEESNQALTAERDKSVKEFADFRGVQVRKDRETRFTTLVDKGLALPAEKSKVLAFASALGNSAGEIELAAEGGKTEKLTAEEAYWRDLEARSGHGLFKELSTPAAGEEAQTPKMPADLSKKV